MGSPFQQLLDNRGLRTSYNILRNLFFVTLRRAARFMLGLI